MRSPRLAGLLAVRERIIDGRRRRRRRALPVPGHPAAACAPAERRRGGGVRGSRARLVALDAVELGFAPVARDGAGGPAAVEVAGAAASRLLRADVILFAIEGLQQRLQALALRADVVEPVVVAADRVGHQVGVAAELRCLAARVAGV